MDNKAGNRYFTQRNVMLAEKIIKENGLNKDQAVHLSKIIEKQFEVPDKLDATSGSELFEKYEQETSSPIKFRGLPTGINTLDEELLGVKRKDLMIIGAETGVGKSTLAMYMMMNFASTGHPCLYMALEDSEEELGTRFTRMVRSNGHKKDIPIDFIYEGKIYGYMIDKTALLPAVEAYHQTGGYEIVCIDMLNNIVDTNNDRDASEFINALRSLATKLGIVILLTCRLRKPQDNNERNYPTKFSFSGKADITFSATKILTLALSNLATENDVLIIDSHKNRVRDRNRQKERIAIKVDAEFKFTDLGGRPYGG